MSSDPAFLARDRSATLLVTGGIFSTLATLTLFLRFAARRLREAKWATDDWLVTIAVGNIWILFALSVKSTHYGLGRHAEAVPETVDDFLQILYIFQIFYITAPATIKLSLLFLYRRIFVGETFKKVVNVLIGVMSVWLVIMTFLAIFNCTPIRGFWTGEGKCFDFRNFAIGYAVVNLTSDFIIWLLPLPTVWKLQLPLPQKIGLSFIFVLGLFDCAAVLARLLASMLVLGSKDPTWDYLDGYIWSIIEPSVGIMCACLPTVRIVLMAILPESWRGLSSSNSAPTSAHNASKNNGWPSSATYSEIHGGPGTTSENLDAHKTSDSFELNSVVVPPTAIGVSREYRVEEERR